MTSPRTDSEAHNDAELAVVRDVWEEVLGEAPSSDEAAFFDDGGTSLAAVSLTFLLEDRTGVHVPLGLLFDDGSPAALARHLAERSQP